MELKQFISQALTAIVERVVEAQSNSKAWCLCESMWTHKNGKSYFRRCYLG